MSITALLDQLSQQGIQLWFEGSRLRFRGPRGALSTEQRAQLVERRDETVAALRERAAAELRFAPLSYGQRSLWFVNQDEPGSAAYHVAFVVHVESVVDRAALQDAFQALVDRHAILRTTYDIVNGRPSQRVAGGGIAAFEVQELPGLDDAALKGRIETDYQRPFDLRHGPVLRTTLYSRGSADHVLMINAHHIALDGWSLLLLLEELRALYVESTAGTPAALPRPELQYTDYADWQAQMLAGAEGEKLGGYWQAKLAAPRAEVELPPDRPRPARKSVRGATLDFQFDAALTQRLGQLARDEGTTLFVLLLAAFKILLFRYSGADDIVVGTPTLGRNKPEFARILGHFVNPVPLRSRLDAQTSLRELTAHLRQTVIEALEGQEYPLALMVERLQQRRDSSRSPLFETMFVLQRFEQFRELGSLLAAGPDDTPSDFGGLKVRPYDLHQQEGQFDLGLGLVDHGDTLGGAFKYNTDLFDAATIRQLAGHYRQLLWAIVEQPQARIGALPLLSAAERAGLLCAAGGHDQPTADASTLHRRFELRAERQPDAIALSCDNDQLSYAGLNQRANRLAHRLIDLGVRPGTLVGLYAERSIDLVVGLLGILKAGGAYLPIELTYPAERVAFMLEDAGATVLVTQRRLLEQLPAHGAVTVFVDDDLAGYPDTDPPHLTTLDDLAYVIYTSGSTGKPKGTMLTHRAVDRLFTSTDAWYRFDAQDVWTLFHSVAFDFSVWELWGALLYGGRVVVVPFMVSRSPEAFLELLHQEGVTVLNQTPSAFRQLMQADCTKGASRLTRLRYVIFGGEALELQSLRPWFDRYGETTPRLVNMYGITETCVHVTYRPITRADLDAGVGSVIGVQIPDLRVHVLDAQQELVPRGVPGEMYVGGPGLARGYLNRPDLTDARFIPDPFVPGERLYRTGDLAKRRANGELEYLGRIDHQVKIRGFRVELGEIEAVIAQGAGVRESVVAVREDTPGNRRLVAYIVGDGDEAAMLKSVRRKLGAALPDYMAPAQFVLLDAMPLTSNGKVDRAALPAAQSKEQPPKAWIAPETPIENTLVRLWSEVLDVNTVSRDDNFFELGGHSLLVVTLLERMRRAGFAADLRTVFSNPVLSAMAAAITVGAGNEAPAETASGGVPADCAYIDTGMVPLADLTQGEIDAVCAVVPGGVANIQDMYALLHQQEGILFHHQLAGNDGVDAYQVRAIMAIDGRERLDQVLTALQAVIDRHDALRTLVLWEGLTHPVQVVCRRAQMVVNEIDDLGGRRALEYLTDVTDRRRMRLVLSKAPLLTAFVARDPGRDEWHLAIVLHHIVVDHVSLGILTSEIRSLVGGGSGTLPAPRPFRDIVARILAAGPTDSEAFFREMLGEVDQPTLPFDLANVQGDGSQVEEAVRRVPEDLSSRIRAAASQHRVSPAVLFHVAWAMVVARCSGRSDVVFGTVLYGRSEGLSGLDTTMGMLINTLPIRVNFEDARPAEVVKATYRRLSQLMRHEHASLALAQRCSRVAGSAPLFSALLNYRHVAVNGGSSDGDGHALEGVRTVLGEERTNYPLMMAVDDLGDGFVLTSQCELSVDPERAVDLLATVLQGLSGALLDDRPSDSAETGPSCADLILELSLLTPAERLRVTHEFNATSQQIDSTPAMVQFERQAARTPGACAVSCEGEALSYGVLNARANRLAHRLRRVCVVPGVLVGVCLERTPDLVVALLGIHKAGGTYVPLDPGFPAERLSFMLSDSGAAVLLTAGGCARGIEVPDVVHVLDLEAEADALVSLSDENFESGVQGRDIAYVIYTSGSTGRPKGVAVSHLSLANFLWSMRHEPGLTAADTVAAVTTISFDIAGLEIFLPLVVGARIELVSRQTASDGPALAQRLVSSGATVLQATPATWRLLVEADWKASRGFRALCGGEALPPDLARALLDRVDELWNLYGPTETTVWSTIERVSEGPITVGRPIANTQIYVVDKAGDVVPVGVAGEIWIGGAGVAAGYHRRAELSGERFVPDHFSDRPGARLYRTGDLGRWGSDGRLHHLGRLDHQVKIRGFRIELGEIESVLRQHPQVRETTVLAISDNQGQQRLVAYVVPHATGPAVSGLREHLRKRVPDYMVPAAFVFIDKLPLTNNGKVDRNALPAPGADIIATEEYWAPVTETEKGVAQVFAEVLDIPIVGVLHNFFELGGHSLLATRALARLRERFKLEIPLIALFQAPTVQGLSRWLDAAAEKNPSPAQLAEARSHHPAWKCLVPTQPNGSSPPLFLITGYMDADDTLRILSNLIPHLGPDQPLCGLRPRWLDGHSPQYSSVAEVTDEYLTELRAFQPRGPYYLVGDCVGGVVAVEMARTLREQGDEVALLVLVDTERPRFHSFALTEIARLWQRGKHVADVLRQFLRPIEGTRRQVISDVLDRKLRRARLSNDPMTTTDHIYEQRTAYQRLLKRHRLQRYPGRIKLIVSDDVHRFVGFLGWKGFADGGLEVYRTPGDHQTFRAQHSRELGQRLLLCIDRAQSERRAAADGARGDDVVKPGGVHLRGARPMMDLPSEHGFSGG